MQKTKFQSAIGQYYISLLQGGINLDKGSMCTILGEAFSGSNTSSLNNIFFFEMYRWTTNHSRDWNNRVAFPLPVTYIPSTDVPNRYDFLDLCIKMKETHEFPQSLCSFEIKREKDAVSTKQEVTNSHADVAAPSSRRLWAGWDGPAWLAAASPLVSAMRSSPSRAVQGGRRSRGRARTSTLKGKIPFAIRIPPEIRDLSRPIQ